MLFPQLWVNIFFQFTRSTNIPKHIEGSSYGSALFLKVREKIYFICVPDVLFNVLVTWLRPARSEVEKVLQRLTAAWRRASRYWYSSTSRRVMCACSRTLLTSCSSSCRLISMISLLRSSWLTRRLFICSRTVRHEPSDSRWGTHILLTRTDRRDQDAQ